MPYVNSVTSYSMKMCNKVVRRAPLLMYVPICGCTQNILLRDRRHDCVNARIEMFRSSPEQWLPSSHYLHGLRFINARVSPSQAVYCASLTHSMRLRGIQLSSAVQYSELTLVLILIVASYIRDKYSLRSTVAVSWQANFRRVSSSAQYGTKLG
jgi:hypothetical protein